MYGRGISPEHARFWSLAHWGHDPLPCGRPARHLGLPESCRFCDASVGDLWHCLSECPEFDDLRTHSGPEDAESHRNLRRYGAAIPGSLILHLFSIRLVRFVLILLLLVLFVNGLTPAQFDFNLVHFCLGGPLLAVSHSESG